MEMAESTRPSSEPAPGETDDPPRRMRTYTDKGQELYENQLSSLKEKYDATWREIDRVMCDFNEKEYSVKGMRELDNKLHSLFKEFTVNSSEVVNFLRRENTELALHELNIHKPQHARKTDLVKRFRNQIDSLLLSAAEARSDMMETRSSARSEKSLRVRKQITRSAEKAQLEFLDQEVELEKQRAIADIELKALQQRKKSAVADAEAKVFENSEHSFENLGGEALSQRSLSQVRHERVVEFIHNSQATDQLPTQSAFLPMTPFSERPEPCAPDADLSASHRSVNALSVRPASMEARDINVPYARSASMEARNVNVPYARSASMEARNVNVPYACSTSMEARNLNAPYAHPASMEARNGNNHSVARDLSSYLLKKDLLMLRFTTFKDTAQHYNVWKASFQSIVTEMDATPRQQLDLLTKWLGPDSKEFAISMSATNITDPDRALRLIWTRLEQMYGRPEAKERELSEKISNFPVLTDNNADRSKYLRLVDLLTEIESAMGDERFANMLNYYNSSKGVLPITQKLPRSISERWAVRASQYKTKYNVMYPPFSYFVQYMREVSERKNDPSFYLPESVSSQTEQRQRERPPARRLNVRKTFLSGEAASSSNSSTEDSTLKRCPIHNASHLLTACRTFLAFSLNQKRDLLRSKNLCFKCCIGRHRADKCPATVNCEKCSSGRHVTCMHYEPDARRQHGGETVVKSCESDPTNPLVTSKCSQLCNDFSGGRSCGKVVLVDVYHKDHPDRIVRMYAIIDDQSNRTLARSKFFDMFNVNDRTSVFTMSSCSGSVSYAGRSATNFVVKPMSGETTVCLPEIIECDDIPDNVKEIPTPEVATAYSHLRDIAPIIPDFDPKSEILLLIGRDIPKAHHVIEQITGFDTEPFAQKLYLGWTIVGEVCLGNVHKPNQVHAMKTHVLGNGRPSLFRPCDSQLAISEGKQSDPRMESACKCWDIFEVTATDESPGFSTDDREFVSLMQEEMVKSDGKWVAPLPFRRYRVRLPNNRSQAQRRALVLDNSFRRDTVKRDHALEFMNKIFLNGHAEPAPLLEPNKECWYLPIFSVYHPQKPNKIRMVFDSSAKFENVSLNSVLLSGPDLTNSLIGVLMKFRLHKVAITADIEQMFYCFRVTESHRDFLRFLWYADNDPDNPLIDHRMNAHVFGNTPSPAIATYGLRRTAMEAELEYGPDVRSFVDNNFYVDDGLISLPSATEAIDLLKRTKEALMVNGQLRLHKIASNDPTVMQAFEQKDLAKDLINFEFGCNDLPNQRSLGLVWDLQNDSFLFRLAKEDKPFTRRGVLSYINSLYDPLGFVSPIIVRGKLILREIMSESSTDWDAPLPETFFLRWTSWKNAVSQLQNIAIPRQYLPDLNLTPSRVVVFSDASESAIAAVAYLSADAPSGEQRFGFVMGKCKVAPRQATSIPRLELCAAVLGVEIARIIHNQLAIPRENFTFFTDSMVVLGYVCNKTRRFLTYVSNRVQRILAFSSSEQWRYVQTDINPADVGTRPDPGNTRFDEWLHAPAQWLNKLSDEQTEIDHPVYDLVDPDKDSEIKTEVVVNKITISNTFSTMRFERFSTWPSLIKALMFLKRRSKIQKDPSYDATSSQASLFRETETFVIRTVQNEIFHQEIVCLKDGKRLSKDSRIFKLDPRLDSDGILRVGGRINRSDFPIQEKNPIVVPGFHHISRLLVLYHHKLVQHQGRHITEGAIRAAGFWITGCKRLVYSLISNCVKCRRTRGTRSVQKMSDLPVERLTPSPPFTYVGVDCFGPWEIVTRRTRGGSANSKRWAALFTCMCSRAIHIEVLEEMSTASFINALRRFYSIRGKVKEFYSDRGSNSVGCVGELGLTQINVEEPQTKSYLQKCGTVWKFNTPYSSHMGGAWERLIGVSRRILDTLLFDARHTKLTHEVLVTFLAEVCVIVNNRPLVPVSTDPDSPFILTPNILLTQKTEDISESHMELNIRNLYSSQWKVVQALADRFWTRWRNEYLQTLQKRQKWECQTPNLQIGDVVIMKDSDCHRNLWPLGRIMRVFPSTDGLVRKVELFVIVNGTKRVYVRPVNQLVLLLSV